MVGPSSIQLDLEWRPRENLLAHRLYFCPSEADCGLISKHRLTMRWGIIFIKVKISTKIVLGDVVTGQPSTSKLRLFQGSWGEALTGAVGSFLVPGAPISPHAQHSSGERTPLQYSLVPRGSPPWSILEDSSCPWTCLTPGRSPWAIPLALQGFPSVCSPGN